MDLLKANLKLILEQFKNNYKNNAYLTNCLTNSICKNIIHSAHKCNMKVKHDQLCAVLYQIGRHAHRLNLSKTNKKKLPSLSEGIRKSASYYILDIQLRSLNFLKTNTRQATYYSKQGWFMRHMGNTLVSPHLDYCSQLWAPGKG